MPMDQHIIHAKWIITCEENNRVLENHALVMQNGIIKDILPSLNAPKDGHHSHYPSHAILPGFINAHTHLPMNFFRGLADDLKLMDWLTNYIWPAEKKWLSETFVYDATLFAAAEMIRSGTTCFNDMFFFMPSIAKAIETAGMRGSIGAHIICFPNAWAQSTEEEFEKATHFLENYSHHPLIKPTVAAHSLYTVTQDAVLLRVKELAETYDVKINMHVQEPQDEIHIILKQSNCRPFERLKQLGLCTPRLIAVHSLHLNEHDIELITECKPNIVHCPESNMKLASGYCPVTDLLHHGVNVALGTDGAASNNDLDMLGEMRTAAFLAKHQTQDSIALPAETALKMATLNGAKALGIDHLTGSLSPNKSADFIAIDLDCIETLPVYHPISHIVYAASRQQVTDVWVAGRQLLKNRQLTTLDENALKTNAKEWGKRIQQHR